jgi:hypothetical protein
MKSIMRDQIPMSILPGRGIQRAIGAEALSPSSRMTVGFARYSEEFGAMSPHRHAEEVVFVVSTKAGWIRAGRLPDALTTRIDLREGMLLHFAEDEWHVFEVGPGGHVDIVFCYGQVDDIRPEDSRPHPST